MTDVSARADTGLEASLLAEIVGGWRIAECRHPVTNEFVISTSSFGGRLGAALRQADEVRTDIYGLASEHRQPTSFWNCHLSTLFSNARTVVKPFGWSDDEPVVSNWLVMDFEQRSPVSGLVAWTTWGIGAVLAPSVRERVESIIRRITDAGLKPERVVESADRDWTIYFFGSELVAGGARRFYASVTVQADDAGSLIVLLGDRHQAHSEVFEIGAHQLAEAIGRIRRFILGE